MRQNNQIDIESMQILQVLLDYASLFLSLKSTIYVHKNLSFQKNLWKFPV